MFARPCRWPVLIPAVVGLGCFAAIAAHAGDADVVGVQASRSASGTYDFAVTVRSRDTGWDRYADRLEAVGADGVVLGTRTLVHPHDDEQPFTRDLDGVTLPGSGPVTIRVHFKPTGFNGDTKVVKLPEDAR